MNEKKHYPDLYLLALTAYEEILKYYEEKKEDAHEDQVGVRQLRGV